MSLIIAVDGPAASGKGTIARALARRFGFLHLDTGLLYRAVAAIGGEPVQAARALTPEDLLRPGLRSAEAGQAASRVAAIPEVRAALVDFQRRFALQEPGAVLDGRDIGTVIAPDAAAKLFVTASSEARAERRWRELCEMGLSVHREAVLHDILARDERDSSRAAAPLRMAGDAHLLDTTALDRDQAIAAALAIVAATHALPANDA